jgi:hypothetical protein
VGGDELRHSVSRLGPRARADLTENNRASLGGAVPSSVQDPEADLALGSRVSRLVEAPDLDPIVCPARPSHEHMFGRAQDRAGAQSIKKGRLGIRSESSGQPAGVSPVRGDARVPGSEAPVRRRGAGCEAGWINWPVRSIKRSLRRRHCSPPGWAVKEEPSPREQGEGHGTHLGAWSGCGGTSRRIGRGTVRRLSWELGRPSSARSLRGIGAASVY